MIALSNCACKYMSSERNESDHANNLQFCHEFNGLTGGPSLQQIQNQLGQLQSQELSTPTYVCKQLQVSSWIPQGNRRGPVFRTRSDDEIFLTCGAKVQQRLDLARSGRKLPKRSSSDAGQQVFAYGWSCVTGPPAHPSLASATHGWWNASSSVVGRAEATIIVGETNRTAVPW